MENWILYPALILIGLLTGSLTGLTGASGVSMLISGLLLAGMEIRNIIALTFIITFLNSAAALPGYFRAKNINIRSALYIGVPAAAMVFAGFYILGRIKAQLIIWIIILALFAVGVKITFFNREIREAQDRKVRNNAVLLIVFGSLIGFIMGALGSGGGLFISIVLILLFHYPAKESIGISIFVMGLAALSGLVINISAGRINFLHAAVIAVPSVSASLVSSHFANKINEKTIKRVLGIYLIIISVVLIVRELFFNAG